MFQLELLDERLFDLLLVRNKVSSMKDVRDGERAEREVEILHKIISNKSCSNINNNRVLLIIYRTAL